MVILTGVSGFIGSCMLTWLNEHGFHRDVVVVDDFYKIYKDKNFEDKAVREFVHRDIFLNWFESTTQHIDLVIHLGARTDTTSTDTEVFDILNLDYSKRIFTVCAQRDIPLLYASSAATYGDGNLGFSDDHAVIPKLQPLNAYARSKNDFDLWVLQQKNMPKHWAGFKFFNVYGPNEYHKARMASVIFHTYHQIRSTGKMKLFRSHKEGYADGQQKRDFIYVMDVLSILGHFVQNFNSSPSGIYNLGTGLARTFEDLATNTFTAMGLKANLEFIDMPEDIRESYQYFTEADMSKLSKEAGYDKPFYTLEEGIKDYVQGFLMPKKYY
ncbi:MAG: ADP-glyceromanno-heptose 6-epimerase [Saprospiraceae bacterium]|nr:ADP-glyceromanno-heptose 6-epimerase [Saprospiraceae bacterium]